MTQIDLEEAIAATKPLTVRAFAEKNAVPEWRVRHAIKVGTLEADQRKRPMIIKEGELALTVDEWQRAIKPATERIKSSLCGWSDGGKQFQVLDGGGQVHVFRIVLLRSTADSQRREIDRIKVRRIDDKVPA